MIIRVMVKKNESSLKEDLSSIGHVETGEPGTQPCSFVGSVFATEAASYYVGLHDRDTII